jgi:hypothetical protein
VLEGKIPLLLYWLRLQEEHKLPLKDNPNHNISKNYPKIEKNEKKEDG